MRINRYMSHAVVLLFAAVLYGVSFSTYLKPANGPIDVRAANVGDASMGRDTAIIKPIPIPTAPLPSRAPIFYTVKAGDTPAGIAKTLGVTLREITWSNPGLRGPRSSRNSARRHSSWSRRTAATCTSTPGSTSLRRTALPSQQPPAES
ncbi:MAG: LysM peptidoglycan-binding domain-containing protein [Chloroflexi bacterium]|nr:MAG: LysM peptidoglycan-binding domain-containing protein [Chloroflexota bacterium]